jgi:Ser/Thr protein kinase RdoA (MazF antagonist)
MGDRGRRPEPSRSLRTALSTLTWSEDGSSVTKAFDLDATKEPFGPRLVILGHHRARPTVRGQFSYELRVNQLLARHRPGVPTPRLVAHDRRAATLTFEAVAGGPLGPKYPLELSATDLDGLVALAQATRSYPHRPRWLRRLPIKSRLWQARRASLLTAAEHQALRGLVPGAGITWVFAHGDITPRNVLRGPSGMVLIDWEWAGVYPDGYELAFLWYVLADLPAARRAVEGAVTTDPAVFWLSALLIELLHLEWLPDEFRQGHLDTKDHLVARLLDG